MGKITRDEERGSRAKVEQDDLEAEAAVLTVAAVKKVMLDDPERASGKRPAWTMVFEELGDKVLWLNDTQIDYLIDRLGDDTDTWVGAKVPVEKHDSPMNGKIYPKVWVCAPESWDELLTEAGVPVPKKKAVPVPEKKAAVVKKPAKRGR